MGHLSALMLLLLVVGRGLVFDKNIARPQRNPQPIVKMRIGQMPLTLGFALLLSGCATPYQVNSFTGGFADTQLASDVFRVTFRGNAYTSQERAQDFALLHAAEITTLHGFTYFAVLNAEHSSTPFTVSTPGQSYTSGTAQFSGNTATYAGYTTYTPGQAFTLFKPQTGILIRGFQTKPTEVFTFDAAFLAASLVQKYHLR